MPVASLDSVVTAPGVPVVIRPLDNDQGQALVLVGLGSPAHGSVTVNPDQTLTYTPAPGFAGEDGFAYTVQDSAGETAEAQVGILVNAPPVAVDDLVVTTAATPVPLPVLANDSDPEGGPLSLVAVAAPGHGSVEMLAGGELRYEPQHGFSGSDSFAYTVADVHGALATAMVTVTVADANRPPVARADSVIVQPDAPTLIQLAANDDDPDADPLALTGFSMPQHGLLQIHSADSVIYTPSAGFVGEDSFDYAIGDGRGGTAGATVWISVQRPNAPPVVADASLATDHATAVTIDPLAGASDPDGDPVSLASLTLPEHGQLSIGADYSLTYTPDAGFSGTDAFTYTVADGRGGTDQATVEIEVAPPPSAPLFANGYEARRRLVVPKRTAVAEAADSFVMRVDETGAWLCDTAHGGPVRSPAGFDLRFELEDGTRLPHEIELYDGAAGRLLAWVRLPAWTLGEEQRLLLYYGKPDIAAAEAEPAAVWADYLAVWDARTGTDRSGNGCHLTPSGVAAGTLIGDAGSYPGDAVASLADPGGLAGRTALTFQCWAKADAAILGSNRGILAQGPRNGADQDHGLVLRQAGTGFRGGAGDIFVWSIATSAGIARLESAAGAQSARARLLHGVWRSGELPQLFVDGAVSAASWAGSVIDGTATAGQALTGTTVMPAGALVLGAGSTAGEPGTWKGLIDEARLRPGVPSAARIAAEHASQAEPRAFYGLGDQDDAGTAPASVVAAPVSTGTMAGQRIDIDVLALAHVPAGTAAPVLQAVGQPANGLATIVSGKVRYTPDAGFSGEDAFTYSLAADGKVSTARIAVEVTAFSLELPSPLRIRQVASDAQLTAAIADCLPGDHIVLNGGPYTLAGRTFARSGTEANPIVFRAATPLGVTVKGASWYVSGSRLIFHGLRFEGGQNIIRAAGFDNVVRRCDFSRWHTQAIRPYNGHDGTAPGGRWTVDYCSFHDPLPWDVPPGTEPQPSRVCIRARSNGVANFPYGWRIRRCHFYNGIAKLGPGYYGQTDFLEWPGDGPSHENLNDAGWLCEYVLIENHVGKDAVWDLKCGGNTLRHVTVLDCPGGRLDNRVWRGNRFEGIWLENCGGMDFNSGDHVANGVRMLGGAKLQIIAGSDDTDATGGANPMFQRARNVRIIGAVGGSIAVGYKYSTSDLPALNCRIEATSDCQIRTQNAYGAWATPLPAAHLETGTTWSAVPSEPIVTPIKMTTAMVGNTAPWQD